MEQVQVKLYDDRSYHADGSLVEADASHILELDGRRVKLDLTEDNFDELSGQLARWLDAGSPAAPSMAVKQVQKRKRSGSLKPDHLLLNQAIRYWAAWQDRVAETLVPTGYYYKAKLRADVNAWLTAQQMTPGQFIAAVEAGEYQPQNAGL